MKKRIFTVLALALTVVSCHNFKTDFPDYKYTAGYFPYQYPERILVLGDYIFENDNDNAGKFVVSAAFGGVYENKKDRVIGFKVDNSLCDGVYFSAGNPIKALPTSYYTLSNNSEITIPKGMFHGGVTVQLTEDFFNDPDAIKNTYVLPLVMTGTNDLDSLLVGSSDLANPDLRVESDWSVLPKNFTMFGVKFINEYHGNWFHYGSSKTTAVSGSTETQTYKEDGFNLDVTDNEEVKLITTGRHTCSMTTSLKSDIMSMSPELVFTFNGTNFTVGAPEGADYTVTGSGTMKKTDPNDSSDDYNMWSNKERNYLTYSYTLTDAAGNVYTANDVLVSRDRAVKLETYKPVFFL